MLIGAIALLASIPKVVWIILAVVAAIVAVVYVFSQNKEQKHKGEAMSVNTPPLDGVHRLRP